MRDACNRGFVTATDVADYLQIERSLREAHHVVGQLVAWCIDHDRALNTLTLKEFQQFDGRFDIDICDTVTAEAAYCRKPDWYCAS